MAECFTMLELVPKDIGKLIEVLPQTLISKEERYIVADAYGSYEDIPIIDSAIRARFWVEYDKAIVKSKPMTLGKIYKTVCSYAYFFGFTRNEKKLAYMVCEPAREKNVAAQLLELGWRRMHELMKAKPGIDNKTGLPDYRLSKVQLEIFKYVDQRINGVPTQKHQIEQKTLQVNVDGNKQLSASEATPAEIDRRIAELEHLLENPNRPQLIAPQEEDIATLMMEKSHPVTGHDAKNTPRNTFERIVTPTSED